jgi:hypothetical protein
MELNIEHLAPYLPYRLHMINPDYDGTWEITEYKLSHHRGEEDVIWIGGKQKGCPYLKNNRIEKIKLILRPLSDLIKEINVSGEKFVPMLKIGEMLGLKLERVDIDGIIEYGWGHKNLEDTDLYSFGWYKKKMCFGVWYDEISENDPIYEVGGFNEIKKLFSWHFDVFGLIEAGLAVDINTIKNSK